MIYYHMVLILNLIIHPVISTIWCTLMVGPTYIVRAMRPCLIFVPLVGILQSIGVGTEIEISEYKEDRHNYIYNEFFIMS